jgi:hypothetical protein
MIEPDGETTRPAAVKLDAQFSAAAKQRIEKFLQSFVSFKPTLGLLYGEVPVDGGPGSWSIAAFDPLIVADTVAMYTDFGATVCYEIDGITAFIPQLAHISELEGRELSFSGDRLRPVPPSES